MSFTHSPDPKACSICGAKAIYRAGKAGFCFDHKQDAIKASTKDAAKYDGQWGDWQDKSERIASA